MIKKNKKKQLTVIKTVTPLHTKNHVNLVVLK